MAAAEMNPATAGIAQLCPLMSTKVSTMEDSVYTAVVYCTRLGPHKSKVVWAGCLGGGGGAAAVQEIPQTSMCSAAEAVCGGELADSPLRGLFPLTNRQLQF